MTDTPEPWAMDEARRRAGAPPAPYNDGSLTALAHMIQVYEKPPTPPDVLRARSLVAGVLRSVIASDAAQRVEDGRADDAPALQAVLAALREPRAPIAPTETPEYKQAVRLLAALHDGCTPHITLSGVLDQIDHITAHMKPSPTETPNTAEQAAFKAGFYAGAREERKDGTPYPFRDWKTCFNEWNVS